MADSKTALDFLQQMFHERSTSAPKLWVLALFSYFFCVLGVSESIWVCVSGVRFEAQRGFGIS